jgi:carbonic anhydrase
MPVSSPPPPDRELPDLFDRNRAWAAAMVRDEPDFFRKLTHQQTPRYLWIGCSDSRVPANEIVGLAPGEMFVHRNVANVVVHTDLNCLSVLQYAVEVLEVEHVIVCGHYGCGGVRAAWNARPLGLIDNWLRHVQDVAARHTTELQGLGSGAALTDRLCELNVVEQGVHVCRTTIMQDAWRRGRTVTVHAWVYSLEDGLLRDLAFTASNAADVAQSYERAVSRRPTLAAS